MKARRLVSWTPLTDAQPNWLEEEFKAMEKEVKANPQVIAAMQKRGITDLTFMACSGAPPGYFGTAEQRGRRIAHIHCHDPPNRAGSAKRSATPAGALA